MADIETSAILSQNIYADPTIVANFGLSNRYQVLATTPNSLSSGYYGAIILDTQTNTNYLVNRGTQPTTMADMVTNLGLVFTDSVGGSQFNDAQAFLGNYAQTHSGDPNYVPVTVTTGHSLGGFLSKVLGIANELDVVSIASPGAQAAQSTLETKGFANQVSNYDYAGRMINILVKGDPVSNFATTISGADTRFIDVYDQAEQTLSGRVASFLMQVSDFVGYADELAFTIAEPLAGSSYVVSKAAAGIAYCHNMENIKNELLGANAEVLDSPAFLAFANNENGDTLFFYDSVATITNSVGLETVVLKGDNGSLSVLMDNADGTKTVVYNDGSSEEPISCAFNDFNDMGNLTAQGQMAVHEIIYQKYVDNRAAAQELLEVNPNITDSAAFLDLSQDMQDMIVEFRAEAMQISDEQAQEGETISGGFGTDIDGSQAGDNLGAGAVDFTPQQLAYIVLTGDKSDQIDALLQLSHLIQTTPGTLNASTGVYELDGYSVSFSENTYGGDVTIVSADNASFGYITKYDGGNFQQRVVETVGSDGRTNSAQITLADGLVNELYRGEPITIEYPDDFVFGSVGAYIGNIVGQQLANGELAHDLISSSITRTLGQNLGEVIDFLAIPENSAGESFFDPIFGVNGTYAPRPDILDDFLKNLQAGVVSAISSKIVDELGDTIGIEGIGGEIFDVVGSTITTGIVNQTFSMIFGGMSAGTYSGLLSNGFDFSAPYPPNTSGITGSYGDFIGSQVAGALAGYAGSRLAGEVIEPESETAALFGAAGSALGTAIATGNLLASTALGSAFQTLASISWVGGPLGVAVGVFIGTVLGTVLGNAFGGDEEPAAWAHLSYDTDDQNYYIGANYGSNGGDPETAKLMADHITNGINSIIEASQGKLRSGVSAPRIQIGFEGNEFLVAADGEDVKSFGTTADAIHYAAYYIMQNFDLVGGHAVVMRAWHNSDAENIFELQEDLEVAEAFQQYLANPTGILAMMMDQPDSDTAQAWAAILQRAAELELHLPHEKDLDGGWGEVLLAQGVDPSLIPDIEGDTIVLTDPITGEETIIHHVIGPGYEIVRIEGTDGDDIIEVIVDGPSITYVDAGAGNDTIEGSDQSDIIVGGSGEDIINGNDGNDWLHGGMGDDTIDGGAGDDLVVGGQNNDYLIGSADNDHIYGNDGDDYLFGNEGQDFLFGGEGNDVLDAGEGEENELYGEEGDDVLHGGQLFTILDGGAGNDRYVFDGDDDLNIIKISRGDGHDIIEGSSTGRPHLIQFDISISVNELFCQRDGDDVVLRILGEDQSVTIKDYYGDSSVKPNVGVTTYDGNVKAKLVNVDYSDSLDALVSNDNTITEQPFGAYNILSDAALAAATSDGESQEIWVAGGYINGFEMLGDGNDTHTTGWNAIIYCGAGDDVITSGHGDVFEAIYGDSGNDTINSGAGWDLVVGGLGDDYITAGDGDDMLYGGAGTDTIYGSDDNDHIDGGEGDDYIDGGRDDDNITGNVGNDEIYAGEGNDVVKGDAGIDEIYGGDGNDTLYGGDDNDTITGDAGIDTLFGDEGDDALNGGAGDDRVSGGAGNDTLSGGAGDDVVLGGAGDDILQYIYADNIASNDGYNGEDGNDTLSIQVTAAEYADSDVQLDVLRYKSAILFNNHTQNISAEYAAPLFSLTVKNIENVELYVDNTLQDVSLNALYGSAGGDIVSGSVGNDIIIGSEGNDTLQGLGGHDDIRGGVGNDTLEAGAGHDVVYGDFGDDIILGDAGQDRLFGENGADNISGGGDDDILIGGKGDDTLNGDDGTDILVGEDGSDTLNGGEGDDLLVYKAFSTSSDIDVYDGGEGDDLLELIVDSTMAASVDFQTDLANLSAAIDLGDSYTFSSFNLTVSNIEKVSVLTDFGGAYLPIVAFDDVAVVQNVFEHDITNILNNDLSFGYEGGFSIKSVSDAANGTVTLHEDGTVTYLANWNYVGQDSFTYIIQDKEGNVSTSEVQISVDALHDVPVVLGTSNDDTIDGTVDAEAIYGLEGNDSIHGNGGDDVLYGGAGADYIWGDDGDDYIEDTSFDTKRNYNGSKYSYTNWIFGGEGNDTIISGVGDDAIYEGYGGAEWNHIIDAGGDEYYSYQGGGDEVRITDLGGLNDNLGIAQHSLYYGNAIFERYLDNDLVVKSQDGSTNIVITNQFTDLNNVTGVGVENLFISMDWADLKSYISNYSEVMVTRGSDGDDVINGIQIANKNDEIYAGEGNDILMGGIGNDDIHGEGGDDTYIFSLGDGQDIYTDTSGDNDIIKIKSGLVASDLVFSRVNVTDLMISITGQSGDTITVNNHFDVSGQYTVESIAFDDGSSFDISNLSINNNPLANDDAFITGAYQILQGNVLSNNGGGQDSDPNGDVLNVVAAIITTAHGGTVELMANGDFTYTPADGYTGTDSFEYQINDGYAASDIGSVSITINALPEITGTSANNTLNGTSAAEIIRGLEGNDYIYGAAGDDRIYGGDGLDRLYGQDGDDYIEDMSYNPSLTYQSYLYGGAGDDTLVGGEGKQYYSDGETSGDYNHYIDYGSTDEYYVHMNGGGEVRITDLGGFSDYMAFPSPYPLYSSNTIFERYLDADLVIKNTTGSVNIVMTDEFTDLDNVTGIGVEKLFINTQWIDLKSYVSNYSDVMITRGSEGDDVINGIQIANTDDEIYAGGGDDTLDGGAGSDRLYGEEENDTLYGGEGSDYLYGGDGDDVLYGGGGVDMLYGQGGADIFAFEAGSAFTSSDNIQDFNLSEGDFLDISDILSGYDPLNDAITDFVQITESGSNSYLNVDADGGADNFVQIAYLYGANGLTDEEALEASGDLVTV